MIRAHVSGAHAASGCDLERWQRSAAMTPDRRVVVYDAWPDTGIGMSLIGTSTAIAFLMHAAPDRRVEFASCLPAHLAPRSARRGLQQRVAAARALGAQLKGPYDQQPVLPFCDEPRFELHEHVRFGGLPSLAAEEDAHHPHNFTLATQPTCTEMLRFLRRDVRVVGFYYPSIKVLKRCIGVLDRRRLGSDAALTSLQSGAACLRRVRPASPLEHAALACDVGLHMRSLSLDDERCNQMAEERDEEACPLLPSGRRRRHHRSRRCPSETIEQVPASMHMRMHARTLTHAHIHTHACIHTRMHTYMHTLSTHAHVSACSHACIPSPAHRVSKAASGQHAQPRPPPSPPPRPPPLPPLCDETP